MRKFWLLTAIAGFMIFLSACGDNAEAPDITDQDIRNAENTIHNESGIREADIEVSSENKEVVFKLKVAEATKSKEAKELGEKFIRALASNVAESSEESIDPPSDNSLGDLYDDYELRIGVGQGPGDWLVEGGKIPSADGMIWE